MSIIMLYAANIIVRDKYVVPEYDLMPNTVQLLTGRRLLLLTTFEKA